MKTIIIREQDSLFSAAMRQSLIHTQLSQYCRILSVAEDSPAPAETADIWIGSVEGISAAQLPKQSNIFKLPVRIGVVLDRIGREIALAKAHDKEKAVIIGPYILKPYSSDLTHQKSGEVIRLTDKERHILLYLAETPAPVTPRETLLDEVWGYAQSVETHTLETHIYRLRQKIEEDPAQPVILLTEEEGYRLNTE